MVESNSKYLTFYQDFVVTDIAGWASHYKSLYIGIVSIPISDFKSNSVIMKNIIFILIFIIGSISCQPHEGNIPIPDYTEFVNPLMGSDSDFKFSHGNVYPAIARPWGMGFCLPR